MIIQIIALLLATVCSLLFIVGLLKGIKYDYMVSELDSGQYPLKSIYSAGFCLNDIKLFKLRGGLETTLKFQASLVWGGAYSEYYANLAWAQFLSMSLLFMSIGFLFAGFIGSNGALFFMLISLIAVAAVWNMTLSKMKDILAKRKEDCIYEFPNMVSKLSLLINSGMVLREAWYLVAKNKEGELYTLMKQACEFMENGESDSKAIYKFGILCDTPEIKKFTGAVVQGIEKGNSELVDLLIDQASELWAHKRQLALQKGEIAAGKLILPLAIMFGGVMLIIIAAAMQSMTSVF